MENDALLQNRVTYNYIEDDDFDSERDIKNTLSAVNWKNACIRALKLRRQLKNGTYFKSKTTRDVAGHNIDIAAIDYNKGYVAAATSKRKNI